MSRASYQIGEEFAIMNMHAFQNKNAVILSTIGKIIGYTALFAGTFGALYAWVIESNMITLCSLLLAAVGMGTNTAIHKIALKLDQPNQE
ncbi:MAG: hypothetical protein J6V25_11415 [Oscillospiraceae bacterium]|nr:hypothetical protein [Oscillospiraceae bacterium]